MTATLSFEGIIVLQMLQNPHKSPHVNFFYLSTLSPPHIGTKISEHASGKKLPAPLRREKQRYRPTTGPAALQ